MPQNSFTFRVDMKNKTYLFLVIIFALTTAFTWYNAKGTASYYAQKFHGRKTASGEVYHKDSLTAAHKTLPFGTKVLVTNLENDSSVVLKINDRIGSNHRLIDVSYAAAEQLNFVQKGLTKVRVEAIDNAEEIPEAE